MPKKIFILKVCEIRLSAKKKCNVSQHISTDKHQKALKRHKDQKQKKKNKQFFYIKVYEINPFF